MRLLHRGEVWNIRNALAGMGRVIGAMAAPPLRARLPEPALGLGQEHDAAV